MSPFFVSSSWSYWPSEVKPARRGCTEFLTDKDFFCKYILWELKFSTEKKIMGHQNPYKHLDDHSDLSHKQLWDAETEKANTERKKKVNFLKS